MCPIGIILAIVVVGLAVYTIFELILERELLKPKSEFEKMLKRFKKE